jgi:hypothetical protein
MKPTELHKALETLGLNQPEFAAALNDATGRSHVRQHVNAWLNGRRPIPDAVAMFVAFKLASRSKPAKSRASNPAKIKPVARRKSVRAKP